MNFLEEIASEWYEYQGYFVRTNVKFGSACTVHLGLREILWVNFLFHGDYNTITDFGEKRKFLCS